MKTIILYASTHHGNTKQLAEAMAACVSADTADLTKVPVPDLSGYDLIGFASGIYFGKFHEKVQQALEAAVFSPRQRVFFAATCGAAYRDYTKEPQKTLNAKGVPCAGSFVCRGYDTYGIFGKIGGIAKGRPNARDLQNARQFITRLTQG